MRHAMRADSPQSVSSYLTPSGQGNQVLVDGGKVK